VLEDSQVCRLRCNLYGITILKHNLGFNTPLYFGFSLDTCSIYELTTPKRIKLHNQIPCQGFHTKPNVSHPMIYSYGAIWIFDHNLLMGGLTEQRYDRCHIDAYGEFSAK